MPFAPGRVQKSAMDSADADLLSGIATSADPVDCRMTAHDLWPRRLLERREGLPVVAPSRVFWPKDDDEVARLVRAARRERRPLVPFGAGSGVCGGISPASTAWVLDLHMPVMDGPRFLQERAKTTWSTIPVVVLSAWADRRDVPEAFAKLTKPVQIADLLDTIRQAVWPRAAVAAERAR